MSMRASDKFVIPEDTAKVARAAFPKGCGYMTLADKIGVVYQDSKFAPLFSDLGRPAESPGRLALISAMQFAEGLTDRQAAHAVRSRIDWKYVLGLELTDPGFDFTVLSDFRERVMRGGAEAQLLDDMLAQFKAGGFIKERGRQRTDSTHVLAAVRRVNRLECIGETLRYALNTLATVAPEWLRPQIKPDWVERYSDRMEQYRLPKGQEERQALAETMGADGHDLLAAIYSTDAPEWLRQVPAVEILRRVWVQQFCVEEGRMKWREAADLPPAPLMIESPYDVEAHFSTKRETNWVGFKVHVTETCDPDTPNLITHVETTPATTPDVSVTGKIHEALAKKDLLPGEHLIDAGYPDADHLVTSKKEHDIDLCGPVRQDTSWQACTNQGFDLAHFTINWEAQTVTCPEGKVSQGWSPSRNRGNDVIHVGFAPKDCKACAQRSQCTQAKVGPRTITLSPKEQHEALQAARERQTTEEFKQRYAVRAGVEGTISQGIRRCGLRRSRYIGQAKTHLQHVLTAASINLARTIAWLQGVPQAQTRRSRFALLAAS